MFAADRGSHVISPRTAGEWTEFRRADRGAGGHLDRVEPDQANSQTQAKYSRDRRIPLMCYPTHPAGLPNLKLKRIAREQAIVTGLQWETAFESVLLHPTTRSRSL